MQQNSRVVLQTLDTFGAAATMEEGREGDDDDDDADAEQAEVSGEEAGGQQEEEEEQEHEEEKEEEEAPAPAPARETVDRAKCPLAVRTIHMAFLSAMVRYPFCPTYPCQTTACGDWIRRTCIWVRVRVSVRAKAKVRVRVNVAIFPLGWLAMTTSDPNP